ncbi:MAG: argininosuccinate synthase [Elusimicrobiota bacterium]
MGSNPKKIVLAYSGGLDTSVIVHWLKQKYGSDIIAVTVEVGNVGTRSQLAKNARTAGAAKFYYIDARDEFVTDYIYPAVKANAVYEQRYLLGTSLARPIIAAKMVEIAKKENADALAHGATGKGNDQVRFDMAFSTLMPKAKIIAPWRDWDIKSRTEEIEYAEKYNIKIPITREKPYSSDENLGHISFEGGVLEDLKNAPKDDMFKLTLSPKTAPNKPEVVSITFTRGIPVKVNGKKLTPAVLMSVLNKIAGRNAVGRVDVVENRLVGIKSRGVYESPGLTLLHTAHFDLESITLDRETWHYKLGLSQKYAELIYNGQWFTPLRLALDKFINYTQESVNGTITMELYKGNTKILARESADSLYSAKLATFEEEDVYNQKDAEGFIKLFGLPTRKAAQKRFMK